jgi:hypothetical protein
MKSNKKDSKTVLIGDIAKDMPQKLQLEETQYLQEANAQLNKIVIDLQHQLQNKEEEITSLKNVIAGSDFSKSDMIMINPTDEELIADVQLRQLKDVATMRALTLEEVKKYDLLVKNKRISQNPMNTIDVKASQMAQLPKAKLLEIAAKHVDKGEE